LGISGEAMNQDIPHYELLDNDQVRVSRLEERHVAKYFPTHRHEYYEIVIITSCEEGDFTHSIDFVSYVLRGGRVYFIAPGQAHAWNVKSYNQEYKGLLITFNASFIFTGNQTLERTILKLFDPMDATPFIDFKADAFERTFPEITLLESEYNSTQSDYFVLRALLEALLYRMSSLRVGSSESMGIDCQRLVEFRKYVEAHFKEERSAEFYARKMQLSAKRLNEICKALSGQTITKILHSRLLLEAKREIISQSKTLQVISDELGFENASYFARFFKKHEGISPSQFAKQMFK